MGHPADFPADAQTGLEQFLAGLNGSSYLSIADQYMLGAKATTRFGGSLYDNSAPPSNTLSDAKATSDFALDIAVHLYQFLQASGVKPDPTGIYFIVTSQFSPNPFYCAFHTALLSGTNVLFRFAYSPNSTGDFSSCEVEGVAHSADPYLAPNNYSAGTHAFVDSAAHEFMETITDPELNAWYADSNGNEVGDACAYVFQNWVQLTNSTRWKIQEEWSNQVNGCLQGDGRPVQLLGAASNSSAVTTFIFNVPGATDTGAQGINSTGAITGSYVDANGGHGFVRDPLGNITTFDAPGMPYATVPLGINDNGSIAGFYANLNQPSHSFVRDPLGDITTFDVPGSVNGTEALSINLQGAIAGTYTDASFVKHAFVRSPSGVFTTFDAPGAVYGTVAHSINKDGTVAGFYSDSDGVSHGFVRDLNGNFTTLSDIPWSINDSAMTTGYKTVAVK